MKNEDSGGKEVPWSKMWWIDVALQPHVRHSINYYSCCWNDLGTCMTAWRQQWMQWKRKAAQFSCHSCALNSLLKISKMFLLYWWTGYTGMMNARQKIATKVEWLNFCKMVDLQLGERISCKHSKVTLEFEVWIIIDDGWCCPSQHHHQARRFAWKKAWVLGRELNWYTVHVRLAHIDDDRVVNKKYKTSTSHSKTPHLTLNSIISSPLWFKRRILIEGWTTEVKEICSKFHNQFLK